MVIYWFIIKSLYEVVFRMCIKWLEKIINLRIYYMYYVKYFVIGFLCLLKFWEGIFIFYKNLDYLFFILIIGVLYIYFYLNDFKVI